MLHAVFEDVLERLDAPCEVALVPGAGVDRGFGIDAGDVERNGERLEALADEFARVDGRLDQLDHARVDAGELEQGGNEVLDAALQALDQAKPLHDLGRVPALRQAVAYELG